MVLIMTQFRLEQTKSQSTFTDIANITHYFSCLPQSIFSTCLLRQPLNLQCRQMQAYTQYHILLQSLHYKCKVLGKRDKSNCLLGLD